MADQKGLAKTSTRTLWKGAITFGLVHIPVALYSATAESGPDFDKGEKVYALLREALKQEIVPAPAPAARKAAPAKPRARRAT